MNSSPSSISKAPVLRAIARTPNDIERAGGFAGFFTTGARVVDALIHAIDDALKVHVEVLDSPVALYAEHRADFVECSSHYTTGLGCFSGQVQKDHPGAAKMVPRGHRCRSSGCRSWRAKCLCWAVLARGRTIIRTEEFGCVSRFIPSSLTLFGVKDGSRTAIANPGSTRTVMSAPPDPVDSHRLVCRGSPVHGSIEPTGPSARYLSAYSIRWSEAGNSAETGTKTALSVLYPGVLAKEMALVAGGRAACDEQRGQHHGIRGECCADIPSKQVRTKFAKKAFAEIPWRTAIAVWPVFGHSKPMMTDLVPTSEAPLAVDRDGQHFNPAGAIAWALKRETRGRPGAVREEDGTQVLLPLGATRRDVRKKVKDRPGRYFLVAVDEDGDALDCPQGEIEIAPEDFGPWSPTGSTVEVPARMFDLLEKMIETQKASQFATQDVVRTLTASIVDQQRAAADLLRAANETIKVATGVDALERQLPAPEVNVEQLAEVLVDELAPDEDDEKPPESWFNKFMTSPAFPMVANLVNGARSRSWQCNRPE